MLLFGFWFYLRYQDYETTSLALQITFLKVAVLAIMVYATNYVLIPRFLYQKKYGAFFVYFLLLIAVSSILKIYCSSKILHDPQLLSLKGGIKIRLYENAISDFFLVSAGAAVKLITDYMKMQTTLAVIAKEKAETELNFLKSQINPHFLFNSLNSVYFLINKDNAEARNALHKFSEMLRFQLYELNNQKIPVEKEISYLKDYVDLQQLRKDEKYKVQFDCAENVKGFVIEPLLLIPFVENAFKHLSHFNDTQNYVKLVLRKANGTFSFLVENSKEAVRTSTEKRGGIGLNNVKRRLELLYPGRHELEILETDNTYTIKLNIQV